MSNARELAELGGSYGTGGFVGMKNRIINGAMVTDQRNAGASVTPSSGNYTLDRWCTFQTQSSKYTIQQNAGSVTPPAGFTNYLGLTVGASANVTVGASDYFLLDHIIEGYNMADLAWGSASAATVTLSFWVRSSVTGTFGGSLKSYQGTSYGYPFSYTINAANTWEQKTITITGPTSTWNSSTTNGGGVEVLFSLGAGSNFTGPAGAWASTAKFSSNGATNLISTNSATFYITGVQLEKGSTATSFDYRPYGTELALCQRYYERFTGISSGPYRTGYGYNTSIYMSLPFQVTKRTTGGSFSSSASGTTLLSAYGNGSSSGFLGGLMTGSINFNTPELTTMTMYQNLTASTYSPYGTAILWTLNNNQWVDYSAEL